MKRYQEIVEREERAKRLVEARKAAGFRGPKEIAARFPSWNLNNFKAHEAGRNGFGIADAKMYATAFGVNASWLQFGIGQPGDKEAAIAVVTDVPRISRTLAGRLGQQQTKDVAQDSPTEQAVDLPPGDWICLEVGGAWQSKLFPEGSIVFVNRKDKGLVANAIYVVADEAGVVDCARYRSDRQPTFQYAFDEKDHLTIHRSVAVIGRVRRSVLQV
jgi:hypothetical protein